jgi:hypothetical protein
MNTEEYKCKVHNPVVAKKRGEARSRFLRSDDPRAKEQIERIKNLNPMKRKDVREKVSKRLREIKHKPIVQGGNGRGMTEPQKILFSLLAGDWKSEYAISLGKKKDGYPTCYKVDLGLIEKKIAIELDGNSHYSRKSLDKKKDDMLSSLGWKVIRFWNKDVIDWHNNGCSKETHISETLKENEICLKMG